MKKAMSLRIPFAWEDRRPIFLGRCLYIPSHYEDHENFAKIPWSDPIYFGNDYPVVIEYCSGNGQWILERAKENPRLNWVAVEKKFDRARKIWKKIHTETVSNLFVVCGEALTFSKYYVPHKSISKIFVNFPDPWPKHRHAKNRLIQSDFLLELEKILMSRASAFLNTDDFPYVSQMLAEFSNVSSFKSLLPKPYFATNLPDYGSSYFHDLWKAKGRKIYSLQFEVN